MNRETFDKLSSSPAAFRAALLIDTDGAPRRLSEVVDPWWQQQDFEALDPAWVRVVHRTDSAGPSRGWLERPRGHSKTSDLAVQVCWALFSSRRKLDGVAAAADKDQARLLRDAVDRLVRLNAWLKPFVDVQAYAIKNPTTGSHLEVITSDAATSYGRTPDFIIADEITHWKRPELWDSLLSSAAKRNHCLLLVITNAGFMESWQWKLRESVRIDPNWFFHALDGPQASWIDAARLDEQRRLLPSIAFDRLWLNEWGTGSGDALSEAEIQAACTLSGPMDRAEDGQYVFVGGVDIGLAKDATAFVVIGRHVGGVVHRPPDEPSLASKYLDHREPAAEWTHRPGSGRFRLAMLKVWKASKGGKVSLSAVEDAVASAAGAFRLACVGFDPWQAVLLAENLRGRGIRCEQVDFVPANLKGMAAATLDAFGEGRIEIYPDPRLLADLRSLRVAEKSYGIRLESPRGPSGHGDTATALAIALHVAGKYGVYGPPTVTGPLLCWP